MVWIWLFAVRVARFGVFGVVISVRIVWIVAVSGFWLVW